MKRFVLAFTIALALAPAVFAQNQTNGELGVFFNYTRLADSSTNFYGIGGRLGFNVRPNIQLEAECAYDFQRNVNSSFFSNNGVTGVVITNATLHMIHGLFGPKLQIGTGAFRLYGTVKGGLINFSTSSSFPTQVSLIRDGDTDAVFYPGGGVEFYAGPVGIRAEVGDEIWFSNGANHNLRITVGPQIRF